jgi:phosphatidate cytidylyltransferase
MPKKLNDLLLRTTTAIGLGIVFGSVFVLLPPLYFSLLLGVVLSIIIFLEWPQFPLWCWFLLPFYPVLPFFLLICLNQSVKYHPLLYFIFLLTFANDSGAYIAGSLWGKTKIAPTISPNKSWEGFVGGYLLTTLVLIVMITFFGNRISPILIPIALGVSVFGTAGDFFESWLKRRAGIKNSGRLLPGHGGFLDRFDSILAVAFLFFIFRSQLILILL